MFNNDYACQIGCPLTKCLNYTRYASFNSTATVIKELYANSF